MTEEPNEKPTKEHKLFLQFIHLIQMDSREKVTIATILKEIELQREQGMEVGGRWSEKRLKIIEAEANKFPADTDTWDIE